MTERVIGRYGSMVGRMMNLVHFGAWYTLVA